MHSYTKGLLCSTAAAALMASVPAQANDMSDMRAELQNLLDRMERIEEAQVQTQVAETSAVRTNRTYIRKRAPKLPDRYNPQMIQDLYIMPEMLAPMAWSVVTFQDPLRFRGQTLP